MVMEDNESCGSRVSESAAGKSRQQRRKEEVYTEISRRLKEANHPEAQEPNFDDHLLAHFNRLPAKYAMDMNPERAEDVLTHKRLLQLARDPANRPVFDVRLVQVHVADGDAGDSVHSRPLRRGRPMHEITFSTLDKPKLLTQLTSLLPKVGLNIQEAHAFSTGDGYSLDVFVVDGWSLEEVTELRIAVQKELANFEMNVEAQIDERRAVEGTKTLSVDEVNQIFLSINLITDKHRVYGVGSAGPILVGQSSGSSSSSQLFTQDQVEQLMSVRLNEQKQQLMEEVRQQMLEQEGRLVEEIMRRMGTRAPPPPPPY